MIPFGKNKRWAHWSPPCDEGFAAQSQMPDSCARARSLRSRFFFFFFACVHHVGLAYISSDLRTCTQRMFARNISDFAKLELTNAEITASVTLDLSLMREEVPIGFLAWICSALRHGKSGGVRHPSECRRQDSASIRKTAQEIQILNCISSRRQFFRPKASRTTEKPILGGVYESQGLIWFIEFAERPEPYTKLYRIVCFTWDDKRLHRCEGVQWAGAGWWEKVLLCLLFKFR